VALLLAEQFLQIFSQSFPSWQLYLRNVGNPQRHL
jgi:hypothetical protein